MGDKWDSAAQWRNFEQFRAELLPSLRSLAPAQLGVFCALSAERGLPCVYAVANVDELPLYATSTLFDDAFEAMLARAPVDSVSERLSLLKSRLEEHWIVDYSIGRQAGYALAAFDQACRAYEGQMDAVGEVLTCCFEVFSIYLDGVLDASIELDVDPFGLFKAHVEADRSFVAREELNAQVVRRRRAMNAFTAYAPLVEPGVSE